MTDSPSDDSVLGSLQAANPVPLEPLPLGTGSAPTATDRPSINHAHALFQEIIMTDPSTTSSTPPAALREFGPAPTKDEIAPRRTKKRGFALTGVAAATAAAVGFGAVALAPGSMPAAQAAMISAAESTDAADAGTAVVTVTTDAEGGHEFVLTTAFDGADLTATISGDDMASEFGGTPEVRVVDGTIYLSDGSRWFSIDDPRIAEFLATAGVPVDVRNSLSTGIVELVKSASNVEQVDTGHYRATVTVEEAQRLAAELPSLGIFADNTIGTEDLPADVAAQPLDIDLRLDANGLIDIVTIEAETTDPATGETVAGSISIDLNDLGTAQDIVAPADAESMDIGGLLGGD